MKLNPISSISFKGKIIDAHMHAGQLNGKEYSIADVDTFISTPLKNGDTIDKVIISNLSCLNNSNMQNETDGNLAMLKQINAKNKYSALAVCQPKTGKIDNIKQLFSQNPDGFIGLKFHPDIHQTPVGDNSYIPYLKFAEEKNLPCVFHCEISRKTGTDEFVEIAKQYSSPKDIYKMAKKVPNTPIIMAHMGAGGEKVHKIALDTLIESIEKGDAKLYADISWVDCNTSSKPNIINAIKKLQNTTRGDMTERLIFGSDAPIAEFDYGWQDAVTGKRLSGKEFYTKTITDIKQDIKNNFGNKADELIDKIFYKNAQKLFFEPKTSPAANAKKAITTNKSSKVLIFGAAIAAAACAIYSYAYKKDKNIPQKK